MKILQTVNLGKSQGNKASDVRYTVYNTLGTVFTATTNTGIYEMGSSTGVYGVQLDMSTQFSGSILWSVDGNTNIYATEEIKTDQKMARYIHTGRWKIDKTANQMIFYEDDNVTELAKYDLLDSNQNGSVTEIFERVKK